MTKKTYRSARAAVAAAATLAATMVPAATASATWCFSIQGIAEFPVGLLDVPISQIAAHTVENGVACGEAYAEFYQERAIELLESAPLHCADLNKSINQVLACVQG